jgi:hypothetical protein
MLSLTFEPVNVTDRGVSLVTQSYSHVDSHQSLCHVRHGISLILKQFHRSKGTCFIQTEVFLRHSNDRKVFGKPEIQYRAGIHIH